MSTLSCMSGMRMGCNSMCNKRIVVDEISDDLSANIMLFGYRPAGRVARWVDVCADRKTQGGIAICYNHKKAFRNNETPKYCFSNFEKTFTKYNYNYI